MGSFFGKCSRMDERVKVVSQETGLPYFQALKKIREAKQQYSLGSKVYVDKRLYLLSDEELADYVAANKKTRKKTKASPKGFEASAAIDGSVEDGKNGGDAEARRKQREEEFARYVEVVSEATGWDSEVASAELKRVKQAYGVPYFRYVNGKYWENSDEEIVARHERAEERRRVREARVSSICTATGWNRNNAEEALDAAMKKGIPARQYVDYGLYDLSGDELDEFALVVERRKGLRRKEADFYVDVCCKKSGWSRDVAVERMNAAKENGVSYLKFVQKGYWELSEDEACEVTRLVVSDKARISNKKLEYIEGIRMATGWSRAKAELEVGKAKLVCGASYEDYLAYRFWEKTPEQQREYVTLGMFDKMRLVYNDHGRSVANFDDKAAFNNLFSDLISRVWFVNRDISYEDFSEKISGLRKVIIKPLAATKGIGVTTSLCNESEEANRDLYERLLALPESIVEEYVEQHSALKEFAPDSVNTVRITTLNYEGECKFIYCVFRMGGGSAVDNFHAGGVAAGVNMETGVVETDAADLNSKVYTHSPVTGKRIKGFAIPNWDKIIDACKLVTGRIEGTNLVGWDFAVTEEGVELIEGNPGVSYVLAQTPYVDSEVGLYQQMVGPYLDFYNN